MRSTAYNYTTLEPLDSWLIKRFCCEYASFELVQCKRDYPSNVKRALSALLTGGRELSHSDWPKRGGDSPV